MMVNTYPFAVLYLVITAFDCFPDAPLNTDNHNRLSSVALSMTLAVTLWTTALISYRIYSTSKHIPNRAKPRFHKIMEIIVQSSFIYLLALVMNALFAAIPFTQSNFMALFIGGNYVGAILHAITVCRTTHYILSSLMVIIFRASRLLSW